MSNEDIGHRSSVIGHGPEGAGELPPVKERMKIPRQPMPQQSAEDRVSNFSEVALGFDLETAVREAQRCLDCKDPKCISGCPVQIPIPQFVLAVARHDLDEAARILLTSNCLGAICGRVCPQETQCEIVCVRSKGKAKEPVGIGRIERFVADWAREKYGITALAQIMAKRDAGPLRPAPLGQKVAVVGSGPAGLTCARDLASLGYSVTIFEALHQPGGVLMYGIPEFRLPKAIVEAEIGAVLEMGVKLELNTVIGKTYTISELFEEEGFDAIFLGTGAGLPVFLNIVGENLKGVFSANEYLTRANLMKAFQFPQAPTPILRSRIAGVLGAGNTAMDAARTALRCGAEKVMIIYRRSRTEMPARAEEVEHAEEEGIEFHFLTAPKRYLGDADRNLIGLECVQMELGEPDESGRRRPVEIPGSEFVVELDTCIVAVGARPNPLIAQAMPELKTDRHGALVIDLETHMTSVPGIFAGGDISSGAATVIAAMGDGKRAAQGVDGYLTAKREGRELAPTPEPSEVAGS